MVARQAFFRCHLDSFATILGRTPFSQQVPVSQRVHGKKGVPFGLA
jgi:hypothetical protein